MEGKTALLLEMSQWNSNDLVEQIETLGQLEHSRGIVKTPENHLKTSPQERTAEFKTVLHSSPHAPRRSSLMM